MDEKDRLARVYKRVAEESRKIDKRKIKWECMGPAVHGIKRVPRMTWYNFHMSRQIYPLVICPHNRKLK